MQTITLKIPELAGRMKSLASQVPYAASLALNELAYYGAMEAKKQVGLQLEVGNPYTASSIQYKKATKRTLTARIGSTAWYMPDLIEGSHRTPSNISRRASGAAGEIGIYYQGKRYLFVPVDGKRKQQSGGKTIIVRTRSGGLVVGVRNGGRLDVVGSLVAQTNYTANTFDWSRPIDRLISGRMDVAWRNAFSKAIATAK